MNLSFDVSSTGSRRVVPVTMVRAGNPMVFDTTWTGGPVYFLYDDGKVSLQSQNLPHIVSTEFGHNGVITLE